MKYVAVLLLLVVTSSCLTQNKSNERLTASGYLVFKDEDLILFFPCEEPLQKDQLDILTKVEGRKILHGVELSLSYKANNIASEYVVGLHIYDEANDSFYDRKSTLKITPIKLIYDKFDMKDMGKDNGFAFSYQEKEYPVSFIDDWNVGVYDIKFLK